MLQVPIELGLLIRDDLGIYATVILADCSEEGISAFNLKISRYSFHLTLGLCEVFRFRFPDSLLFKFVEIVAVHGLGLEVKRIGDALQVFDVGKP